MWCARLSLSRPDSAVVVRAGRNWANLTTLVPAAIDTGGSNQRSVRFAGRGRDDNNFTYDGIDATNVINQAQQSYVRLAIPLGTIQEFRVDPLLATAEEGATGGGQLAVTSTSGTNAFHGSVFEFFRNDFFDARQPIDNLNPVQPPFRLNQFGGTFGGPITKDKTFFFVSYEGYRQRLGQDRTRGHGARHLHLGFRLSSQTSPLYQRLLRQRSAHPVEVLRPHPPRPQ